MLSLGHYLGRQSAHVIYDGAMKAFEDDRMLLDVLLEDERVTSKISKNTLEELLHPDNYIGSCSEFVNRAVKIWENINK